MKIILLITISIFLSFTVSAFSLLIHEPVNNISTPISSFFNPSSLNPFGDIRDIFLGQTISGQLHNSSQFYSNNQSNFGPLPETCDTLGNLNQVFSSIKYPMISNPFPQSTASAGIVSISPSDMPLLGINPPASHSFSCFTPLNPNVGSYMVAIPSGFTINNNLNLGVGITQIISNNSIIQSCNYFPTNISGYSNYFKTVFEVPSFNTIALVNCPSQGWCCLNQSSGIQIARNQIVQVSLCDNAGYCDVKTVIG